MKLFYFNFRGKGEMLRLLLHLAGVEFEDCRITTEQLETRRKEFPFGQVPVLELRDGGSKFAQSTAILTYIAREYGYYGSTNLERLEIDQILELILDYWRAFVDAFYTPDENLKAQKMEDMQKTKVPKLLNTFERLLSETGTGYIVGGNVTCADVAVFSVVEDMDCLSAYPRLAQLREKIQTIPSIKKYLASRPKTPF